MKTFFEWGSKHLNKRSEELCGDSIVFSRLPDCFTFVLSDGLGSGVKANILATLTTKIASHMLEHELPIDDVVETVSQTLPICKIRKIAYSTFCLGQLFSEGHAHIFEYDTPPVFFLRHRKIQTIPYDDRVIQNKIIKETQFELRRGDWLIFVSDGAINAGIGGVWNLGWGWDNIANYLQSHTHPNLNAQEVADDLAATINKLYDGMPGDDVSVAVIKVRRMLVAALMFGPPVKREDDALVVQKLMATPGLRIVCGGTTANIVSRELDQPTNVDLTTMTEDLPPVGSIDGLDLVTEGILTLSKTVENLKRNVPLKNLQYKIDGASSLTRSLMSVDAIKILVGQAMNPAHQEPRMPVELGIKTHIAQQLADELIKRGKEVELEYF
jgi:hypothetical protein